jgi:hypothetical protein
MHFGKFTYSKIIHGFVFCSNFGLKFGAHSLLGFQFICLAIFGKVITIGPLTLPASVII